MKKEFYSYDEFQKWLKNHPEVVSGEYYQNHYKKYNDSKLPSVPNKIYKKNISEIFGNFNIFFYTWVEFQQWLKNHPEVISGIYYKKHYKGYNDSKLPSKPNNTYKKSTSEIFGIIASINMSFTFYTWEEFQEWLKNHPEVINGHYYTKYYKEYKDPKLPAFPNKIYKMEGSKIFGTNREFYLEKEFQEWLKNNREVVSENYYQKHYKEYNDPKLPSNPRETYKKKIFEIFYIFYTFEEFQEWLRNHPDVVSGEYYKKHYKEYNDPKLPSHPSDKYNKKIFEIFSSIQCVSSDEKKKIFEQRVQISGNDYFILTLLYGFEMEFNEEKVKSYYKSIGGSDVHLIKCFDPNYIPKYDGHRFDGFESELSQITTLDIISILRFDTQRFFNLNKKSLENDDYSCIEELKNDNTGGEYFLKYKKMILSYDIQNYKLPTNFKSKKALTLFQKLTAIDFMR